MSVNACYQRKPNNDPNPSKWPWTHRGWWCDHRPHLRHQRASKPQGPSIPIAPRGHWCVSFKMSKRMTLCAWIEMKIPDQWRFWCSSRFVQCGGTASWVGCSWSQHISTTRAHGDTICSLVMTKCYARGIHCIDLDCWKECLHRFIVKHPEQVQTNCSEIPQAHSARRQDCKSHLLQVLGFVVFVFHAVHIG